MGNEKNNECKKKSQSPSAAEIFFDAVKSQSVERASEALHAAQSQMDEARAAFLAMSQEEQGFAILAPLMQRDAVALATILSLGVDPNTPISSSGTTGLMLAIHNQDQAAIRLLLPVSDVSITSLQGVSALSAACLHDELDLELIKSILPIGREWKVPKEASSARWMKSREPSALWELVETASAGWLQAAKIVLPHVDVFDEHRGRTALDLMLAGGVASETDARSLRWMRDAMQARDAQRTQKLIERGVREFHQKIQNIRKTALPDTDGAADPTTIRMVAIDLRERAEDIFFAWDALASPEMSEESLSRLLEIGAWMQRSPLLSAAQKEANALRQIVEMEGASVSAAGNDAKNREVCRAEAGEGWARRI